MNSILLKSYILAKKMMINAGFAEFANLEVDTPLNNYYLATK